MVEIENVNEMIAAGVVVLQTCLAGEYLIEALTGSWGTNKLAAELKLENSVHIPQDRGREIKDNICHLYRRSGTGLLLTHISERNLLIFWGII